MLFQQALNIPLNITEVFQGAALDNQFKDSFIGRTDQFLISMGHDNSREIQLRCSAIGQTVTEFDFPDLKKSDIDRLIALTDAILTSLSAKIDVCYQSEDTRKHGSDLYTLYRKQGLAEEFLAYLTSDPVQAATSPYIILTGDGGVGKSHLIADYVENRTALGQISLLLLCQSISSGDNFLSDLPGWIGCTINYYEFFDALETIALSQQSRVLICLDALNEGLGVRSWGNTLAGIVDFLKGYPHIGLVASVRTQYEEELFTGHDALRSTMLRVEHTGFSDTTYEAMHRYFSFYGITTDAVVFPHTEFSNPLFLRLFCKSHQHSYIRLEKLSLPAVYRQYIEYEEGQVAEKCGYHKAYKLISQIIGEMTSKRMAAEDGAVRISLEETLKLIVEISKQWNVTANVYNALLQEGILTQSMSYDGNVFNALRQKRILVQSMSYDGSEYVHITYERLEDYFVARKIIEAYEELTKDQFMERYSWVMGRTDLLEFLGIILAEEKGVELRDVFSTDDPWKAAWIRGAFLYGLTWRKAAAFTEKTWDYIDDEILEYEDSFQEFIDLLFALSARADHPLNAAHTFNYFQKFPMPERDAEFIPVFDVLYADHSSALYRLLEWGLNYSRNQCVPDDVAERSALILCWLLISPNTELRDRATKAIICILLSHTKALISLMTRFEEIDDPYILERIYAIAFGCVVNEECPQEISALAKYVYTAIFDQDTVYPNILLRTYAKNIIDYAKYMGCIENDTILLEKIMPPYSSRFPEIPSDEEIRKYKLDYTKPDFKNHRAQNMILNSMKVEYSRDGQPGGYGDFGRYTFQYYFSDWKQLHPMDLKNIAVKRIFELGYDVELHGHYDRERPNPARVGRQQGKKERIGKKYQWIALYELAAQVSDHYQMTLNDGIYGDCVQEYCRGSFEPNIRDIDPTVLAPAAMKAQSVQCHIPYAIPGNSYEEWLSDFSEEPSFEQCVTIEHEHRQFLLLTGNYDWIEPKRLGTQPDDFPRKNLWYQIRGYIVKREHLERLLQALNGADFMSLWMPELQNVSEMYNKEYYWSDASTFFKSAYYGNADWVTVNEDSPSFQQEILIPVRQYFSERRGDLNTWGAEITALNWYKPCEEILTKLRLQYVKGSNSQFTDFSGELICFDSSEVLGDESGFYIRQDKFQNFLNEFDYSFVWTFLCEKRILSPLSGDWDLPPKAIHMSAVYCLRDGKIEKTSEVTVEDKLFY